MYLHPSLNVGPGVTNGYLQKRSFICAEPPFWSDQRGKAKNTTNRCFETSSDNVSLLIHSYNR